MSADSGFAVQAAIYERLSGSAELAGLVTGVYDHVPQGAAFPYVAVGGVSARPFDTQGSSGVEMSVALHVFSRAAGLRETHAILAALHEALHEAQFGVEGHVLILCRAAGAEAFLSGDGMTRQGTARFHIIAERID